MPQNLVFRHFHHSATLLEKHNSTMSIHFSTKGDPLVATNSKEFKGAIDFLVVNTVIGFWTRWTWIQIPVLTLLPVWSWLTTQVTSLSFNLPFGEAGTIPISYLIVIQWDVMSSAQGLAQSKPLVIVAIVIVIIVDYHDNTLINTLNQHFKLRVKK